MDIAELVAVIVNGVGLPALAILVAVIYANLKRVEERVERIADDIAYLRGKMDVLEKRIEKTNHARN